MTIMGAFQRFLHPRHQQMMRTAASATTPTTGTTKTATYSPLLTSRLSMFAWELTPSAMMKSR